MSRRVLASLREVPERLSAKARRLVDAGENVVSVASYWEVVIKAQKGVLSTSDLTTWWRQATELTSASVALLWVSRVSGLDAGEPAGEVGWL